RILAFAAAAAAVAAIAFAALSTGSSDTATPAAQPGDAVAPVDRAHTTVAVLNSTRTPGLARAAATALQRHGWKIGTVTNGPDQPLQSSCLDVTPGHSQPASTIAQQHRLAPVVRPSDATPAVA